MDSTDTIDMANGPPFPANPLCTLWLGADDVDRLILDCVMKLYRDAKCGLRTWAQLPHVSHFPLITVLAVLVIHPVGARARMPMAAKPPGPRRWQRGQEHCVLSSIARPPAFRLASSTVNDRSSKASAKMQPCSWSNRRAGRRSATRSQSGRTDS